MHLCVNCGSPAPGYVDRCPRCNSWLSDRRDNLVGAVLSNKYKIEEHLGSGGMCNVYRARHVLIGKEVAIKLLKPELAANAKIAQRFKQEAMATSRVRHPNAIDVTDYGVDKHDVPFIVMEFVKGETLGEILRRSGALTVERAGNILRQICGALEAAHGAGVIHRDIKPDNILIAEHEGRDWVEVTDFGVAKIMEDVNRRAPLTGPNFIIGTPRYMSPEQCEEGPVDSRTDIYSLGVVMYEMLTGEPPFEGNSTRLLIAHTREQPAPLREKRPDLSPEVEAVVMRSLEKDPALRPQSAAEFYSEFAAAAGIDQEAESADAGGAFSRFTVPINDEQSARAMPDDDTGSLDPLRADTSGTDDEATLVRGRSNPAPPVPPPAAGKRPGPYKKRGLPILAGAMALIVALALFGYVALRDEGGAGAPVSEQVADSSDDAAPEAVEPMPQESAVGPAQREPAGPVDVAEARREVEAAIYDWASALEERDLKAHIDSYAPRLDIYYLKRGVNRVYVQADRSQALSRYADMSFKFSNMNIEIDRSGRRAVATFDKEWNFKGASSSSGSVREMVWLENMDGRWRITGERDLKVHYRNSG